jgi:hypothetical protein
MIPLHLLNHPIQINPMKHIIVLKLNELSRYSTPFIFKPPFFARLYVEKIHFLTRSCQGIADYCNDLLKVIQA